MLFNFNKITEQKILRWQRKNNTPKLIQVLENGNYKLKALAAQSLGAIKSKKAIPILVKSLDSEFKDVVNASIKALINIGETPYASQAILKCKKKWEQIEKDIPEKDANPNSEALKWKETSWDGQQVIARFTYR